MLSAQGNRWKSVADYNRSFRDAKGDAARANAWRVVRHDTGRSHILIDLNLLFFGSGVFTRIAVALCTLTVNVQRPPTSLLSTQLSLHRSIMSVDILTTFPVEVSLQVLTIGVLGAVDVRHLTMVSTTWRDVSSLEVVCRALGLRWGIAIRLATGGAPVLSPGIIECDIPVVRSIPSFAEADSATIRVRDERVCASWRLVATLLSLHHWLRTGHELNGSTCSDGGKVLQSLRRTLEFNPLTYENQYEDGNSILDFALLAIFPFPADERLTSSPLQIGTV